jgi:hypothetical protein
MPAKRLQRGPFYDAVILYDKLSIFDSARARGCRARGLYARGDPFFGLNIFD